MGSLTNGSPPAQKHQVVRNQGHSVILSDSRGDDVVAEKTKLSHTNKLKQLEDSILGMSSRAVWLDASDIRTVTTSSNLVTRWDDKTANGLYADNSDLGASAAPIYLPNAINGRHAMHFDGSKRQSLTMGTQLDSVFSPNRGFTIFYVVRPTVLSRATPLGYTYYEILTKYSDSASTLWFYLYNADPYGVNVGHIYSELYGGPAIICSAAKNELIGIDRTQIVGTTYTPHGAKVNRIGLRVNGEIDAFKYQAGGTEITDSDEPFVIGNHNGTDWNYTSSLIGYFAELLVFNKQLDSTEIGIVENYLALKWNVSSELESLRLGAD